MAHEPSEKVLALIAAHARGPDAFLAGRAAGLKDEEILEIMTRWLEKEGL